MALSLSVKPVVQALFVALLIVLADTAYGFVLQNACQRIIPIPLLEPSLESTYAHDPSSYQRLKSSFHGYLTSSSMAEFAALVQDHLNKLTTSHDDAAKRCFLGELVYALNREDSKWCPVLRYVLYHQVDYRGHAFKPDTNVTQSAPYFDHIGEALNKAGPALEKARKSAKVTIFATATMVVLTVLIARMAFKRKSKVF